MGGRRNWSWARGAAACGVTISTQPSSLREEVDDNIREYSHHLAWPDLEDDFRMTVTDDLGLEGVSESWT